MVGLVAETTIPAPRAASDLLVGGCHLL